MIIPFRVTDKAMITHLNRQENRSEYLRSLIRADMQQEKIEYNIEAVVVRILEEKLGSQPEPVNVPAENLLDSILNI